MTTSTTLLKTFHTVSIGAIILASNPSLFLTVIKTAVSWVSVTSLYNRFIQRFGILQDASHHITPQNKIEEPDALKGSTNTIRVGTHKTIKRTDCSAQQGQITLAFKTGLQCGHSPYPRDY